MQDVLLTTGRVIFSFEAPLSPPSDYHMLTANINMVSLPRSWHTINPTNNRFVIDGTVITLTNGNYSAFSLASLLQADIRALGGVYAAFLVQYSSATNKLRFTGTSAFSLEWDEYTRRWLGMTRGTTTGSSTFDGSVHTLLSEQVVDVSYTKAVRMIFSISSLTVAQQASEHLPDLSGTLAVMPVSVGYQGIINYMPSPPLYHPMSRNVVESLVITMSDDDGNPIYMNGADWEAYISMTWAVRDDSVEF